MYVVMYTFQLPINAQNEQSVTASNQPIQTQQQPNSAQQGQVKEKPTPSHKEPPPPGPIQCADRTPLQEGVTCSAWFNCKLDEETDGSTRPASCWSETGTSADPSFNVFDGVTKACSKATSLHGCGIGIDFKCVYIILAANYQVFAVKSKVSSAQCRI